MDNSTPVSGSTWDADNGNGNGASAVESTMDKAKQQTSQVLQQAQEKAGEVMGQARGQIVTQLAEKKGVAAEGLSNISLALRQASMSLQGQNQEKVGHYAETAAEQLERFGDYLQEQDVEQIIDNVQDYARRNPALILGSTFALGFLAARFLKNAGPESPSGNLPMRVEDTLPPLEGTAPTLETTGTALGGGDASFSASPDLSSPSFAPSGLTQDYSTGVAGTTGTSGSAGTFNDTDLSSLSDSSDDTDLSGLSGTTGASGASGSSGEGLGNNV